MHIPIEKLKYNVFIKEDAKLEDLKYKEEIFEFVAFKSNFMSEKDIIVALEKLENHVILETELKEFKFFIRNILEIQDKFNSEFAIVKFIKYFIKTYNTDLKKYFDPNYISVENNKYDLEFDNIFAALLNFALLNLMKIENNYNFKSYLDLITLINFTNDDTKKKFLEKIQIKFLQNVNLNLVNSPFSLRSIFDESELKEINCNKEEDLWAFLLINIILYQENNYPVDELFNEIIIYFNLKIKDNHGMIKYWNSELNTRPRLIKNNRKSYLNN